MGSRKPVGPRGLCAYYAEIKECDNTTFVPEESAFLIKKCILDKIFSENLDSIAICRSDATSNVKFLPANCDGLREGLRVLSEKRMSDDGGVGNPIAGLDDVVDALIEYAEEDTYEEKKLLYFSNLSSYVLDEEELTKLAEKLRTNDIFMSVILPDKVDMTEIQLQNSKLIKRVLEQEEYENVSFVTNLKKARQQILNTQSKKPVRPSPWNVQFEITPNLAINVAGYARTRKNDISAMTRVLVKHVHLEESSPPSNGSMSSRSQVPAITYPSGSSMGVSDKSQESQASETGKKTVVVEPAKQVVEKESIWTENDGTVVSQDDIGKAYYFGDKLVPYNDLENENSYQSGPKCLKLLAFCPKDKIKPPFLTGDGTMLFYPTKNNAESEVKLKALIKAMVKTDRIAIVRRVYRLNSKVTIGTLVPDEERKCLIFTEVCFADDVSIPQFPYLIKPEELANDEDEGEVNEKEAFIDELIKSRTINDFDPNEGPTDPAVKVMREKIAQKLFQDSALDLECKSTDNIDVFFDGMFADDNAEILDKIRKCFHLKENTTETGRLAGKDVFRKRSVDESLEYDVEKKPKLEEKPKVENVEKDAAENSDELDDLLDEL